jgi:hypothetical protein
MDCLACARNDGFKTRRRVPSLRRRLRASGRIDIDSAAEFDRARGQSLRRNQMIRILFAIAFVLAASVASAQQGHDACARDVSRFCRAVMNDGDMAVLACLQQHRARISKGCQQVLISHGQ